MNAIYTPPLLYPKQRAAIYNPAPLVTIEASTKSGKTIGCLVWLFERAMQLAAGNVCRWVAPTFEVAGIAYRRLKNAIPRELYQTREDRQTLTLANGVLIEFRGADKPDSLYGEDVYALVIDEASRMKEEAWHACQSTLTATKGPVRIIGNVRGRHNWFYRLARLAESGEPGMHYDLITAYHAIEGGVLTTTAVDDARKRLPDDVFRELYLGEPTDDGANPFGLKAIADCVQAMSTKEPVVWGWDFARAQDWTVGIGLDEQGHVCRVERWQHLPWGDTKRKVVDFTGDTFAIGDSTGVGDAVVEDLQQARVRMVPYPFTAKSKQQLMERLAGAIQAQEVTIPPGVVRTELETFEYEYTAHGVRYTAPDGLHDDCVMALALALYGYERHGFRAAYERSIIEPAPVRDLKQPNRALPIQIKDGKLVATHRKPQTISELMDEIEAKRAGNGRAPHRERLPRRNYS